MDIPNNIEELAQHLTIDSQKLDLVVRIVLAGLIFALQIILIKLLSFLLKKLKNKASFLIANKLKPIKVKNVNLLGKEQMVSVVSFILDALKWVLSIAMLVVSIPIILAQFEPTKNLASTLFGYILTPLKGFGLAVLRYIPNVFSIVIILLIARYILRLLKFFTMQIATKKLVIKNFFPEWAFPTFNILRILTYAFTIAMVFPLLPGSDSQIFQGVSLLVGLIFSFGSSSVVGNLVAGIVLTYTRPFQVGDRIKINEVIGFVVEKTPMVTRLRTHKNEFVSFPNLELLKSNITNYNSSTREGEDGLVLHTEITFGYSTPWPLVHKLLLEAADRTEHIQKEPKPFVQQKALDDFYCCYELNAFTKNVEKIYKVYSDLHQNIQDTFSEAGLSMTAAHFYDVENHSKKQGET